MRKRSSLTRIAAVFAIITVSISNGRGTHAGSGFSTASLNGTYAFRTSGNSLFTAPDEVTSSPVFLAAVGVFVFDGAGRLKGTLAVSATRSNSSPSGKHALHTAVKSIATQK